MLRNGRGSWEMDVKCKQDTQQIEEEKQEGGKKYVIQNSAICEAYIYLRAIYIYICIRERKNNNFTKPLKMILCLLGF
jgi:CRISPR/Cas system CMR-associated protein Cmr1 (group 7 of RAMP superfamily)